MLNLVNSSPASAQRVPPTAIPVEKSKEPGEEVRPIIGVPAAGPIFENPILVPTIELTATPEPVVAPAATEPPLPTQVAVANPSFFQKNISGPERFNSNLMAGAVNFLLAMILATAFGFFGNLLNNTIESNEAEFARLLSPVRALTGKFRSLLSRFDSSLASERRAALAFVLKLLFVLFLHGLVLSYLDPSFGIGLPNAMFLVIALMFSSALMALIDDISLFFYVKSRGGQADLRLHSGNFFLVLISTFFSRLFGLVPGIMLGSPAGLENVKDNAPPVNQDYIALGVVFLTGMFAWVVSPFLLGNEWLNTVLLLIFAAGVQALFFELMPVGYLRGRNIFRSNRYVWFGLFTLAAFLFLHTMLNPNGDFVEAFKSPNMLSLSIMVTLFCAFSGGVWFYFRSRDPSLADILPTLSAAAPDKPPSPDPSTAETVIMRKH